MSISFSQNQPTAKNDALLDVRGLKTSFRTMDGIVHAVDGVNFSIKAGQTLGIVGESGCGKSVTSLSVMRLLSTNGFVEDGEILFEDAICWKCPKLKCAGYVATRSR